MNQKILLAQVKQLRVAAGKRVLLPCAIFALTVLLPAAGDASPQFARAHQVSCTTCHVVPPMLNETGLAYQADGYRLPVEFQTSDRKVNTVPLAVWITGRFEDQGDGGADDIFLPKVELISGGTIGDTWSYFAEWRIVSLSLNADGSQRDRGGRFEDLFLAWSRGSHELKFGQYRSLNQVDVSLRLSASEPQLFGNGLRTGTDHVDPRLASLSRFSPASRSPSLGWSFRSIGESGGDGLFHFVTVPFAGELSLPLSEEASETASFELGAPKGVYAETFYRRGMRSIGGHVFVSDESWLATALGTLDWRNLLVTAGFGVDDEDGRETRHRASLQAEVLLRSSERWRGAVGARVEDLSDDNRRAAFVPYLAIAGPNETHTLLFQLQYKDQEGADSFVFDVSLLF